MKLCKGLDLDFFHLFARQAVVSKPGLVEKSHLKYKHPLLNSKIAFILVSKILEITQVI
jgi:hypothetical protein